MNYNALETQEYKVITCTVAGRKYVHPVQSCSAVEARKEIESSVLGSTINRRSGMYISMVICPNDPMFKFC